MAPSSRVEVAFDQPELRWSGSGYFDTNDGDEPLGGGLLPLDLVPGGPAGRRRDPVRRPPPRGGRPEPVAALLRRRQPPRDPPAHRRVACRRPTFWRMARETRSDDGRARVLATYEDTPFYARSLLASTLCGEPVRAMHESLSLDRFRNPLVRLMLPFRMPRSADPVHAAPGASRQAIRSDGDGRQPDDRSDRRSTRPPPSAAQPRPAAWRHARGNGPRATQTARWRDSEAPRVARLRNETEGEPGKPAASRITAKSGAAQSSARSCGRRPPVRWATSASRSVAGTSGQGRRPGT